MVEVALVVVVVPPRFAGLRFTTDGDGLVEGGTMLLLLLKLGSYNGPARRNGRLLET